MILDFVKQISDKINFFIPDTFYVISKEKLSTILLDPNLKQYLISQAKSIGYSSEFLTDFFKMIKESSKAKFRNGRFT
jgi:hypothetical protein